MNKRKWFFYSTLVIATLFNFPSYSNSFIVNDIPFSKDTGQSMSCQDIVQLSLDANCLVEVLPIHLLTSNLSGNYTIEVYHNMNLLANPVDGTHAFDLLNYVITSETTGNSCSGILMVMDLIGPVFDCPQEAVQIFCNEDPANVPAPILIDNCASVFNFIASELWYDTDFCDDGKKALYRTYHGVDYYGNDSEDCLQHIEIIRQSEVDFPNNVIWSCDQYDLVPSVIDTFKLEDSFLLLQSDTQTLDLSNIPADSILLLGGGSGVPTGIMGVTCSYSMSSSDIVLTSCGSNQVIIRTWLVLDWCTNNVILENAQGEDNVQLIFISDVSPPIVSLPSDLILNAEIPASGNTLCKTMGYIPGPLVSDNCSSFDVVIFCELGELVYQNGVEGSEGGFIPFPGLGLGTHSIEYKVRDACNNETIEIGTLIVEDNSVPVMVTAPSSLIGLNELGLNEVLAQTFDQGSFDNCCLDYFEIKKQTDLCGLMQNLEFSETIQFCCAEIGSAVPVVVRAVDCFGNTNEAVITVFVQDNIDPELVFCPDADSIQCNIFVEDYLAAIDAGDYSVLEVFGVAQFNDNCFYSEVYDVILELDDCTEGYVERSWQVLDASGSVKDVCSQYIYINQTDNWGVRFQEDLVIECPADTLGVYETPAVFDQQCALIATAFNDIDFNVGLNTCYAFFREWTVINWCTYDIQQGNVFIDFSEVDAQIDFDGNGVLDSLVFHSSFGAQNNSDGIIQHTQLISIIDETAPEVEVSEQFICLNESNCLADLMLAMPVINDCSSSTSLTVSTDIPNGDQLGPYVDVPAGIYEATYLVTDNCDNSTVKTVNIIVEDCTAPIALCQDSVYQITINDSVFIHASDLAIESVDNCNALSFVFESLNGLSSYGFSCEEQGEFTYSIIVSDASGNVASCTSTVVIQDTIGYCLADDLHIAGAVMTENINYLEDIDIHLEELLLTNLTDNEGSFEFNNLLENDTFTLRPFHDGPIDEGVTTLDVVRVKQHILQIQLLNSPYKLIAADVNNSGTITTIDIVMMRKVILGLDAAFPNNESWRFVPVNFEFDNPENPFQEDIPEYIIHSPLEASNSNTDFFAIKVGDVNNSVDNLIEKQVEERNYEATYPLYFSNQDLLAGQSYTLTIQTKLSQLLGLQGRLNFDTEAIEIEGFKKPYGFDQSILNLDALREGVLTFAFDNIGNNETSDFFMIELSVRAKRSCKWSELIWLDSSFVNEAYLMDGSVAELSTNFIDLKLRPKLELGPNPFKDSFTIWLSANYKSRIGILRMYSPSGLMLSEQQLEFNSGDSSINVQAENISGLCFYQLEIDGYKYSGRLIAY